MVAQRRVVERELAAMYYAASGNGAKPRHRLGWAGTCFGWTGYLENSARGVWSLTGKARQNLVVDAKEALRQVHAQKKSEAKHCRSPA